MGRPVKYSTTTPSGSIRKGDMAIGIDPNTVFGPTSNTGFYTGVEPPSGGYTVYINKASQGPSIYTATDSTDLINITRDISGTTYANAEECLEYYSEQSDKLVVSSTDNIPNFVTDGLVLNMNAQSGFSYPTTGSTWSDLSGEANNGTLTNGPTFDSNGAIVFDGTNDYVNIPDDTSLDIVGDLTLSCWLQTGNNINTEQQILTKCYLSPSQNISYRFYIQNSYFVFYLSQNGTSANRAIRISTTVLTNTIYNVICIYTGSEMNVYINGVLSNDSLFGTIPTSIFSSNSPLFLGAQGNTITTIRDPFAGKIFSSQIYNRALTQTEIKQNYFQAPIVTDGLVFAADAGNIVSYESGSTTTYSLTGSISGSLINGTGFNRDNGGSFVFDGVDDYIDCGNISTTILSNNQFTFSCWFKMTGTARGDLFTIKNFNTPQDDIGFFIDFDNKFYAFFKVQDTRSGDAPNNRASVSTTTFNRNTIYNIVCMKDASQKIVMYVNGILDNNTYSTTTNTANVATTPLWIGSNKTGPTTPAIPFNGNIYNTQIYNRALSSDEVLQNFEAQRKRFGL